MNIQKDFKNKLTKNDYVTYLLTRNMILLLSPIICIALIIAAIFSIVKTGFNLSILVFLLPIVLFILSYIQMFRVINRTIKAQQSLTELKITFTDNEYKDLTNGELNTLSYNDAYCYKETKKHLYLFIDKYNALIIPKREFEQEEVNKITETFSKKIRKERIFPLSSWLMLGLLIFLIVTIIFNVFAGK